MTPLEYMRTFGAFEVAKTIYNKHEQTVPSSELKNHKVDDEGLIRVDNKAVGVMIDGIACKGFNSPSKKQEFYSPMLGNWKWSEYQIPTYIKSHIHWEKLDREKGEYPLIPTFRLPTLIHSRSGNAKWLMEISNRNPLWMHTSDAQTMGFKDGDPVRVNTDIGYFVAKVWITESIRPGVITCSHHLGRWRREFDPIANRWAVNTVEITEESKGKYKIRKKTGIEPSKSKDPDTERIFWEDGGVHQNITFPVHPDPISGMHCWHQKIRVEKAHPGDKYGDIYVDTDKSMEIYREWLGMTRPGPNEEGLRRPLNLKRPLRPTDEAFYKKST